MKTLIKCLSALSLLGLSFFASASQWQIDNTQSQLNFISIKKTNIVEVHQFQQISGTLSSTGDFELNIDLSSVNTSIQIRDQRMKEWLFESDKFPQATLSATIEPAKIDGLVIGKSNLLPITATLALHGQTQEIQFNVMVTKVSEQRLLVVSAQPIVIQAQDFDLIDGIEKLRELAGLSSISYAVPVSFYISLTMN